VPKIIGAAPKHARHGIHPDVHTKLDAEAVDGRPRVHRQLATSASSQQGQRQGQGRQHAAV